MNKMVVGPQEASGPVRHVGSGFGSKSFLVYDHSAGTHTLQAVLAKSRPRAHSRASTCFSYNYNQGYGPSRFSQPSQALA